MLTFDLVYAPTTIYDIDVLFALIASTSLIISFNNTTLKTLNYLSLIFKLLELFILEHLSSYSIIN